MPNSKSATGPYDRAADRLGWLLLGPLAIWSIPALLAITVPAAAAGVAIVKTWPQGVAGTLASTAAIGSAASGVVIAMLVSMLGFFAQTCGLPIPIAADEISAQAGPMPSLCFAAQPHPEGQSIGDPESTDQQPPRYSAITSGRQSARIDHRALSGNDEKV